ncbi:Hypothetical predicted protein [Octopus vulgaris]|uniref:Uncharacterized protein n=1 Tax=Octopus vulgaris TaxID=6645 RepID=A0AA36AUN0_OCTVU|nr:Hypothetical predicted protein [Octopus vulgaris]
MLEFRLWKIFYLEEEMLDSSRELLNCQNALELMLLFPYLGDYKFEFLVLALPFMSREQLRQYSRQIVNTILHQQNLLEISVGIKIFLSFGLLNKAFISHTMNRIVLLILIISYVTVAMTLTLEPLVGPSESESAKRASTNLLKILLEGTGGTRIKKGCTTNFEHLCTAQEAAELAELLRFLESGDGPGKKPRDNRKQIGYSQY